MAQIKDSTILVQFYIDYMHGKEAYEYTYITIVSIDTHTWAKTKYRKVSDIQEFNIGDDRFKEIHFTIIKGKRAYRMTKIGKIVEKMSIGVDL